jgi:hypothetical protein
VILEHSVLGLHYLSSPCIPSLLSCNPLSRALQYILLSYNPLSRALYFNSFPVCITSTSIPASLRCTCFDIARQISATLLSTFRANPHRPRRTLRPTDRNRGGNPADAGGGGNPPDGRLSDKLIGREPEIYDGERAKVENFLTEWNVYRALNDQTWVMATPLERTMLFLTFIRGPKVGNWVNDQVKTVGKYIRAGGHKTDEFIWDTVIDEFANTYQDIMSHERAENELNHL